MHVTMNFKKSDLRALEKLQKESPKHFKHALSVGALQLLTWMNTGSVRESRTPPIRWGILRGSSSAFVGGLLVGVGAEVVKQGAPEPAEPIRAYAGSPMTVTIIYNTDYATKMHEWKGGWGPYTLQAGNAGNKWIEKHLIADKDLFMETVAREFKKEAKT